MFNDSFLTGASYYFLEFKAIRIETEQIEENK
jgi:hypothetical protein